MAGRGSTTFQKRQKEQARKEKRAEKLARRQGRKQQPYTPGISDADPETPSGDHTDEVIAGTAETGIETGIAAVPEP
ncbi:MAG TPA: hypothetical protein VMJ34_21115 [Bryobacteraceae bacterium]|nr:hypothetical protein [Bryobacteraceae bacterium]